MSSVNRSSTSIMMMGTSMCAIFLAFLLSSTDATDVNENVEREEKLVSVFQVVKFQNVLCIGSGTRNGTCFTSAECDNIGGSASGTCADGFGVCCIIQLTAAGTISHNNSFITQTAFTTGSSKYNVCPCSDDICRIKFVFNTFELTGPVTASGTTFAGGVPPQNTIALVTNVGDCNTDTFQITSPCGAGSPVICGTNANQHMFIDVGCGGTECASVDLGLGFTSVTRSLDIQIIQYKCGDLDNGGPPGCLQYFNSEAGRIRSFNFPDLANAGTVTTGVVHLSSQNYLTCIRRGIDREAMCITPCTSIVGDDTGAVGLGSTTAQPSFGLSISANAAGQGQAASLCSADYIWFSNGALTAAEVTTDNSQDAVTAAGGVNRFCGRYLATQAGVFANQVSLCSYDVPFRMGFITDEQEVCTNHDTAINCESVVGTADVGGGGGILGFSICYTQLKA